MPQDVGLEDQDVDRAEDGWDEEEERDGHGAGALGEVPLPAAQHAAHLHQAHRHQQDELQAVQQINQIINTQYLPQRRESGSGRAE